MLENYDYEIIDYKKILQNFSDVDPTQDSKQLIFDTKNLSLDTIKFMKGAMNNYDLKIKPLSYLIRYLNEEAINKKEEFTKMKIGLSNRNRILAFGIHGIVKNKLKENIFDSDSATDFLNEIYKSTIINERIRQKKNILKYYENEIDFRIAVFLEHDQFLEYVPAIYGINKDQAELFLQKMITNDTKEPRRKFEILVSGKVQNIIFYPNLYPSSDILEKFFYKYKDQIQEIDFFKMYQGLDHNLSMWRTNGCYKSSYSECSDEEYLL
jgi:hypothetical protein